MTLKSAALTLSNLQWFSGGARMISWTSRQGTTSSQPFPSRQNCSLSAFLRARHVFWSCRNGGTWGLASSRPFDLFANGNCRSLEQNLGIGDEWDGFRQRTRTNARTELCVTQITHCLKSSRSASRRSSSFTTAVKRNGANSGTPPAVNDPVFDPDTLRLVFVPHETFVPAIGPDGVRSRRMEVGSKLQPPSVPENNASNCLRKLRMRLCDGGTRTGCCRYRCDESSVWREEGGFSVAYGIG